MQYGAENRIAVAVTSESVADAAANASHYAVHPLGGITRDLFLFALPETNLSILYVSTVFDMTYTDAVMTAEVDVTNDGQELAEGCKLVFELKDGKGKIVKLKGAEKKIGTVAAGETRHLKFDFDVEEPAKWDPEHPNLYRLTCRLMQGNRALEVASKRIGFRQIEVRGNQVFVKRRQCQLFQDLILSAR